MALLDKDPLKKFKEALADIIVSSQGLCTYDACKDVAEREATFLISMLFPESNVQSSNIKDQIHAEIERIMSRAMDKELGVKKDMNSIEAALKVYPKMSVVSEPHGVIPADNKTHKLGDGNADKREGFLVGAEWGAEQKAIEIFKRQNCRGCGTQRCTGEDEWLEGCREFQKWREEYLKR